MNIFSPSIAFFGGILSTPQLKGAKIVGLWPAKFFAENAALFARLCQV
jgi:hypothetical protein